MGEGGWSDSHSPPKLIHSPVVFNTAPLPAAGPGVPQPRPSVLSFPEINSSLQEGAEQTGVRLHGVRKGS